MGLALIYMHFMSITRADVLITSIHTQIIHTFLNVHQHLDVPDVKAWPTDLLAQPKNFTKTIINKLNHFFNIIVCSWHKKFHWDNFIIILNLRTAKHNNIGLKYIFNKIKNNSLKLIWTIRDAQYLLDFTVYCAFVFKTWAKRRNNEDPSEFNSVSLRYLALVKQKKYCIRFKTK